MDGKIHDLICKFLIFKYYTNFILFLNKISGLENTCEHSRTCGWCGGV